jgi:hypothetical protein
MNDEATAAATSEATPPSAGPFGGLTPQEAGRRSAEARKKARAERGDDARPVNARTPLDALRDLMHHDPDAYAEGLAKLVRAGDPRSITIMRELFQSKGSVAIPRAEATIRAMSSEDRRALLLELEARGATLPDEVTMDEATRDLGLT